MPLSHHHPNSLANLKSWKPGQSGNPSGRQKSLAILKELGFDPVREAVNRFRDPKTPNASKDFCLGLITDRVLPKLKAVEIRSDQATATAMLINIIAGTQTPEIVAENSNRLIEAVTEDDDDDDEDVPAELTDNILCGNDAVQQDDE